MNVFDLVATLSLDTKEYERALHTAKGTTVGITKDIGARVDKMKKGFLIGAGAMAAGFAAFGVSSVKTGMEFDSAMSQVAATMGKTMDEMLEDTGKVDLAWGEFSGNLREYAQEMGAHTKFSATEAAEALNYMALAGYDAQRSMETLPVVLNLAAAGNMDLARASDMVTDSISALGLDVEDATTLVDQMAMTASKSNTSVEQLGDAFLTVGGTAKNLKGGTTELSTALGILADNGIKGSEGGTILRNAILSLTAPTSAAKGELEALGVSVYDAEGNMRGLDEIMGDLDGSLSQLTGEERAAALGKIFNKRDLKGIEALLGSVGGRWDELSGYIDEAEGSAQKMADTQLDNLAGDITLLKSAFEGLQISVSDKLTPVIRTFVQALIWCIDNASVLGPIVLGAATAFTVFAVAINIGSIIQGVTTAMAALNAVLLANPIGIIIALVAGLVVAIVALWKNNETFRNKVIAIWGAIKAFAKSAFEAIKKYIVQPIQSAYSTAVNKFNSLKSTVSSVFNSIKSTASKVWNGIKNAITNPIQTAKEAVKRIIEKIKGLFPFSIKKVFNLPKLPKISITTGHKKVGMIDVPYPKLSWNAKAMQNPYLFSGATLFGAGEAGDEMLYGKSALMNDIREAVGGTGTYNYTFNVYATENQSPREIAEEVRRIIIQDEKRRKVAWA